MGRIDLYRPARSRTGLGRGGRGLRHWWWWDQGVRLSRHLGVVYGWRVTPFGFPVRCGSIPDELPLGADPRDVLERFVMGLLRKEDRPAASVASGTVAMEPEWSERFPMLWSYMTQTLWEDGTERQSSSILLFQQDGMIKCMLRDKETGLCLWVSGTGLFAALSALEGSLLDPRADWRADRQQPGQQAKRQGRRP